MPRRFPKEGATKRQPQCREKEEKRDGEREEKERKREEETPTLLRGILNWPLILFKGLVPAHTGKYDTSVRSPLNRKPFSEEGGGVKILAGGAGPRLEIS